MRNRISYSTQLTRLNFRPTHHPSTKSTYTISTSDRDTVLAKPSCNGIIPYKFGAIRVGIERQKARQKERPLARRTITCIPPICILFAFLRPPLSIANLKITAALPNDFPFPHPNFHFSPLFSHASRRPLSFLFVRHLFVISPSSSSRLYHRPSAM
jgi:hypothetical protein